MAPGYTLDVLLQDEEMSAVAVTGNGPLLQSDSSLSQIKIS